MKKFELTKDCITVGEIKLFRIKALVELDGVEVGDLGGYIEKENNLSHDGNAWVCDDAKVYGNSMVYEDAWVGGNAQVCGNAKIHGNAWICDDAKVSENAEIYGNARIYDNARISNRVQISGNVKVGGNVRVYGDAQICGALRITGIVSFKEEQK